jgi:tripartite-type tricarboxylate transporter receptor subunit TctC
MLRPRFVVWMFWLGMTVLGSGLASGQDLSTELRTGYPNRSIRIVTAPAGGSGDLVARLIAQGISGPLGQQVVVDNRPTVTIGEAVAKAPADGYTLILIGNSFWISPLLEKTPFDPIRDFSPITIANRSPNILVVHPSLPVTSVKELIALAKTRPGEINYASTGAGSSSHIAAELFKAMAGINIARVNYKGAGPALNGLIANEVPLMVGTAEVTPQVTSGRRRALAVTSAQPSVLFPGLPTVAASLPNYESMQIQGLLAPAKTPQAIINRLNQEIVRALNSTEMKEKFLSGGVEAVGSSAEDLAGAMKSEMARMGKVIKDTGIKVE